MGQIRPTQSATPKRSKFANMAATRTRRSSRSCSPFSGSELRSNKFAKYRGKMTIETIETIGTSARVDRLCETCYTWGNEDDHNSRFAPTLARSRGRVEGGGGNPHHARFQARGQAGAVLGTRTQTQPAESGA